MSIILGNRGDNVLSSKKRGDIILGLDGDDALVALHGFNILLGGDGDDRLTALSSFNILSGGDGSDTLRAEGGWNLLLGGDGDDTLSSSSDENVLDGGDGDDLFSILGGSGNAIVGGAGRDTISYADTTQGMAIDLAAGTASGAGTLSGIENVIGGTGDDTIIGDDNDNVLEGGSGNDTIEGGAGNDLVDGGAGSDTIRGGAGDDILMGGEGIDTLSYEDSPTRVIVNMFQMSSITIGGITVDPGHAFDGFSSPPIVPGSAPTDTISSFETVIGSAFDDWIQGSTNVANLLIGGAGNDMLAGSGASDGMNLPLPFAANDTLLGGPGNDVLRQTRGNDIIDGGEGFDRLEFVNNGIAYTEVFGVNVNLGAGTSNADAGGVDSVNGPGGDVATISGIEHVLGTAGNDILTGDANANRLEGAAGNDTIDGAAGNDMIRGGAGPDLLVGGAGIDTLLYDDSPNGVIVNMFGMSEITVGGITVAAGHAFDGFNTPPIPFLPTDTVSGFETVIGSAFNDYIQGSSNVANRLEGGDGNDILAGSGVTDGVMSPELGAANDILLGGAGNDVLRQTRGNDVIDGGEGFDRLEFINNGIPYGGTTGVNVNLALGFSNADPSAGDAVHGPGGDVATVSGIEHVLGTAGNDIIIGDANANLIAGGAGNDTLAGGLGIDTLSYEDSPTRVIVNMFNTGIITIGGITVDPGHAFDGFTPFPVPFPAPTDTISGFETVIGSVFNDHIQGSTNVANLLIGGAGNDTLAGSGASDGINLPAPFAANDTLLGGAGDDVLRQSRGNDVIDGGTGFDRLDFINNGIAYGGAIGVNVDLAAGTSYADPNNGDAVNDPEGDKATVSGIEFVAGTAGDDVFTGGDPLHAPGLAGAGQTEFFQPLAGNDTITGMAGRGWSAAVDYGSNNSLQPITVVLGNSNNLGTASDGFGGTDTLIDVDFVRGSAGDDTLVGGSYSQGATGIFLEQFRGGPGNDTIDGGGSDTVIGAYGVNNRVEYSNSPFAVVVNTGVTPVFGTPYGTVNPGTARDGFDVLGGGTDTLIDINVVRGSNFSDTLVGGNPVFDNLERFEGLAGNDTLVGGSGNDEADYGNSPSPVIVNLGATPFMTGLGAVAGGTARDGFGGTDTLASVEWARGGAFDDTLIGGSNALERFTGGPGNDVIDGGSMTGVNYASFVLGTAGASASIANGMGTAFNDGQGGTDMLVNINGLWGSNFNDTFTGGSGDQWFVGQGGDDLIDGGANSDTVSYQADPNGVTVNLALGTATDGWGGIWNLQGTDTLSNIENIEGSSFNDSLTGDANANVIEGGGGADTFTGGGSTDVFRFGRSTSDNTVTDFDDDVLDFSPLFTAAGVAVPPGEDPLEWLVNQGYLIADSADDVGGGAANDTVIQVDLDGSAGAGTAYTVATLMDVTLGTTGLDADNWLV